MHKRRDKRETLKKEIFRKVIHISSALIPLFLEKNFSFTLYALIAAALLYIISEILRINGINIPLISFITKTASRERDDGKISKGPLTLVSGILLTSLLVKDTLSRNIGIYALSFGDGLSSVAGKLIGGPHLPFFKEKTFAGSLACFLSVFFVTLTLRRDLLFSLILALIATFTEALPLKDMDNILIPLTVSLSAYFLPQILKMQCIQI